MKIDMQFVTNPDKEMILQAIVANQIIPGVKQVLRKENLSLMPHAQTLLQACGVENADPKVASVIGALLSKMTNSNGIETRSALTGRTGQIGAFIKSSKLSSTDIRH